MWRIPCFLAIVVSLPLGCDSKGAKDTTAGKAGASAKADTKGSSPKGAKKASDKGASTKLKGKVVGCLVHDKKVSAGGVPVQCSEDVVVANAGWAERQRSACMAKETDPKVLDTGCPDTGAIAVCVKKGGKSRKGLLGVFGRKKGSEGSEADDDPLAGMDLDF